MGIQELKVLEKEITTYLDLNVWKEARSLSKIVYFITREFPKEEIYGLTSQLRRSAISVPSNIAEGCGRNHKLDSLKFFYIARGSLYELETQLYLAYDIAYINETLLSPTLEHLRVVRKLLSGFINYYHNK